MKNKKEKIEHILEKTKEFRKRPDRYRITHKPISFERKIDFIYENLEFYELFPLDTQEIEYLRGFLDGIQQSEKLL